MNINLTSLFLSLPLPPFFPFFLSSHPSSSSPSPSPSSSLASVYSHLLPSISCLPGSLPSASSPESSQFRAMPRGQFCPGKQFQQLSAENSALSWTAANYLYPCTKQDCYHHHSKKQKNKKTQTPQNQKTGCRPKPYEYMFSIADCASPHKSV